MHICGMDFSSLASYWQIKALLMLEPSVVTPQNQYFPANSERMSVHCLESGCIGKYTHLSAVYGYSTKHIGPRQKRAQNQRVWLSYIALWCSDALHSGKQFSRRGRGRIVLQCTVYCIPVHPTRMHCALCSAMQCYSITVYYIPVCSAHLDAPVSYTHLTLPTKRIV